jgi:sigma54-dependent transcription regulator
MFINYKYCGSKFLITKTKEYLIIVDLRKLTEPYIYKLRFPIKNLDYFRFPGILEFKHEDVNPNLDKFYNQWAALDWNGSDVPLNPNPDPNPTIYTRKELLKFALSPQARPLSCLGDA